MCADGRSGTEAVRTGGSHLSSACVVARGPQVPTPASPPRWSVCPAEACYSVSWGFLCSEQASILGTDRGFTLARPQLQVPSGPGQLPRSLGTSTHKRTPPCLGQEEPAPSWTEWPRQQLCPPRPWKRSNEHLPPALYKHQPYWWGLPGLLGSQHLSKASPPSPFRWQIAFHAHPPAP